MNKIFELLKDKMFVMSFVILSALIIGVTGLMLEVDLFENYVKDLHSFIGVVVVVAILFHIWQNIAGVKRYSSSSIFKKLALVAVAVIVISVGASVAESFYGHEHSKVDSHVLSAVSDKIFALELNQSLTILTGNAENGKALLQKAGLKTDNAKTLADVMANSGVTQSQVYSVLNIKRSKEHKD